QTLGGVLEPHSAAAVQQMNVEPFLRDIDPHKLSRHPCTLPCRYGLAQGGPSDCSGCRNSIGRVPAHPRPTRPEGHRTRGRTSGCTTFATLTPCSPTRNRCTHETPLVARYKG